jgi:hypothetical protein
LFYFRINFGSNIYLLYCGTVPDVEGWGSVLLHPHQGGLRQGLAGKPSGSFQFMFSSLDVQALVLVLLLGIFMPMWSMTQLIR